MQQPKLTLYHYWRSSCSWRLRWALQLKGLKYESKYINLLTGDHKKDDFLMVSPNGFLPVLVVNDKAHGESLAIIEWLEEMWPEPSLLPKSPEDKLYVRQLALTIAAGTQPLQNPSAIGHYTDDPALKASHAQYFIKKGLQAFERQLTAGPHGTFCYRQQVTTADLCLIPQVYNALRFQVDMNEFPVSLSIYNNCLKTSACDQAAPHNQQDAVK